MNGYATRELRVYLLDDHDIVRRGLRDLLSAARDITVAGESGSAEHAVRAIPELRVDVMVLDVQLQDGSGVQVCREVRSVDPSVRGLLLTASGDDEALVLATLAGADGYAVKQAASVDLIGGVRSLGAGRSLIDPALRQRVAGQLMAQVESGTPPLDSQKRLLLRSILEGLTNQQIANKLDTDVQVIAAEAITLIDNLTRWAPTQDGPFTDGSQGRHRRSSS
jgi:two-component system response regulator DevR